MKNYIDGFVFPIKKCHLAFYLSIAEKVAEIWKESGATDYEEFIGDDMTLEGTKSFIDLLELKSDEVAIFGWVSFPNKEVRDLANQQVPKDLRMNELVAPLMDSENPIFEVRRMVYGGFKKLG